MRRFARGGATLTRIRCIAVAVVFSIAGNARASSPFFPRDLKPIVFEAVGTPATAICPEPCFQVRIFLEDLTRQLEIQGIQMDIDVGVGARVGVLPVPPATNSNAASGNAAHFDADGETVLLPWDTSATVGKSPSLNFDALLVNAAGVPFSLNSLAALRSQFSNCASAQLCEILDDANSRNLIYLGRFNVSLDGDPQTQGFEVRVGQIQGVGPLFEQLATRFVENRYTIVRYPVPEPPLGLLCSAAIAALAPLGWFRRARVSGRGAVARH
jgi:hypothetical protein